MATPATASTTDASVRPEGFSRSTSHDSSATAAGIVLVMMPAASAEVSRTPFSISNVKPNVPKKAWRNRLVHSPPVTRRMRAGLYHGAMHAMAIRKRSNANSITGMTATIDLPKPTLLPTSAMAAIRKRAWMGTMRNQWKPARDTALWPAMLRCDACRNRK